MSYSSLIIRKREKHWKSDIHIIKQDIKGREKIMTPLLARFEKKIMKEDYNIYPLLKEEK